MSTKDLMLFTTRAKGRFRRTYNEDVKEVKLSQENGSFQIKITGVGKEAKIVSYNFQLKEISEGV